jgi:hypothetical protein
MMRNTLYMKQVTSPALLLELDVHVPSTRHKHGEEEKKPRQLAPRDWSSPPTPWTFVPSIVGRLVTMPDLLRLVLLYTTWDKSADVPLVGCTVEERWPYTYTQRGMRGELGRNGQ